MLDYKAVWKGKDNNEEIISFTNKSIAKKLWEQFGDVPMNPDTEEIEEQWNGFLPGTFREDIWHWFEDAFHISVAVDLMGLKE